MNNKFALFVITIVFLLSNVLVVNSCCVQVETPNGSVVNRKTIYVNINNTEGPWNGTLEFPYQHIYDAVENANAGDVIYVFSGIYYENVIVDKSLSIIGENKSNSIIDGMYKEFVIHSIEDYVSINNFTIRNSGGYMHNAGIKVESKNNLITNCIFYRTKTGIYVNNTGYNEITNCIFYTNGEGIYLKSSRGSKISNCYFAHNGLGLNLESSDAIEINGCYANTNGIAFYFNNSSNVEVLQCAVYNNNDNQGGFFIDHSRDIRVVNCNINHNGVGIKLANCSSIFISNCSLFWNTHFAIIIYKNSEDIKVENSEIVQNLRFGVYIEHSSCMLFQNNLYGSLFGIFNKYSLCNARYNWWGSPFGPAVVERETKDRIFMKFGRITFFPWLLEKVECTGTTWEIDYDLYNIEINNSRYVEIELPGLDSDNDKVPDWWEEKWGYDPFSWDNHKNLDPDEDSLNNIEECFTDEWGSNPFHKDIFLEFDWIKAQKPGVTNKPPSNLINKIKSFFEKHDITFHVDDGSLGGGEEISYKARFSDTEIRDLYWNYFLHNDLDNPRKGIFHYGLICDYGNEGGFAFVGCNHLDSFIIPTQFLVDRSPLFSRGRYVIGGSIHELGHTLGLTVDDYRGIDNMITTVPFTIQWWKYGNYRSCMNYRHTYVIINFSDGSHGKGDFDDWSNLDFGFFKNTHFEMSQK
ncbi:MAG: right-handed parallel beta-helix repeat-containing protein [Thermoplasmatales archaeon]|nr:MAG: right-handed parallel beta-helix repeat-containing protein [Thermoplasmatales archaeon]